jgi:pimeloyl-ACP methyl ester carboxylesterase
LLLIMGFGSTMAVWDPALVDELARTRRVIAFDNRGMGTSSWKRGVRLTISIMADDAWRLVRALGLERVDVLGWSMGGEIAQQLALRHPQVVRRLVLAATDFGSPHAILPSEAVLDALNTATSPQAFAALIFPPTPAGRAAERAYFERIGSQPGIRRSWFRAPRKVVGAQTVAEGERWYAPGRGADAVLPKLRAPTLVTDGTRDIVVPPENARLIAKRLPNARAVLFRGGGHAFLFQFHARFGRLVRDFLD